MIKRRLEDNVSRLVVDELVQRLHCHVQAHSRLLRHRKESGIRKDSTRTEQSAAEID